jgi:hypothetical protein
MRAVSLHRFLPGHFVARVVAYALLIWLVFMCLHAFGVTGVAAADFSQTSDMSHPFRW